VKVRVKLFAAARDIVGKDEVTLSLSNGATVSSVIDGLIQQYPKFMGWKNHVRVAINWEYADQNEIVHDHDEVAVIPPVSGG
jgi:molybdopterin converting factor subunit 1